MKIEVAQNQIQGDREYQQDSVGQRDVNGFKLLVLADGMGGYNGGEIASKIVVDTFMRHPFVNEKIFLEEALAIANKKISEYKELHLDVSNMGTTVIALLMDESSYRWVSVGDSPLYLIKGNTIKRINDNHSVAGMLNSQVERGEISVKKAEENKNRHMLTSAILGEEISMIDVSPLYTLSLNEKLILASDGIETLSENEILTIVNSSANNLLASQTVLAEIEKRQKRNQDNATLIIATPLISKIDKRNVQKSNDSYIRLFLLLVSMIVLFLLWK